VIGAVPHDPGRTLIPDSVGVVYYVHFLEQYLAVCEWVEKKLKGNTEAWEQRNRYISVIGRITDCEETCNSHMVWAQFRFEGQTFEGLRSHMERSITKIHNITRRYTGGTWKG